MKKKKREEYTTECDYTMIGYIKIYLVGRRSMRCSVLTTSVPLKTKFFHRSIIAGKRKGVNSCQNHADAMFERLFRRNRVWPWATLKIITSKGQALVIGVSFDLQAKGSQSSHSHSLDFYTKSFTSEI